MRNYFCAPFILIGIPHIIVWALKSNRSDYSNCYASYFISVNVIFFLILKMRIIVIQSTNIWKALSESM